MSSQTRGPPKPRPVITVVDAKPMSETNFKSDNFTTNLNTPVSSNLRRSMPNLANLKAGHIEADAWSKPKRPPSRPPPPRPCPPKEDGKPQESSKPRPNPAPRRTPSVERPIPKPRIPRAQSTIIEPTGKTTATIAPFQPSLYPDLSLEIENSALKNSSSEAGSTEQATAALRSKFKPTIILPSRLQISELKKSQEDHDELSIRNVTPKLDETNREAKCEEKTTDQNSNKIIPPVKPRRPLAAQKPKPALKPKPIAAIKPVVAKEQKPMLVVNRDAASQHTAVKEKVFVKTPLAMANVPLKPAVAKEETTLKATLKQSVSAEDYRREEVQNVENEIKEENISSTSILRKDRKALLRASSGELVAKRQSPPPLYSVVDPLRRASVTGVETMAKEIASRSVLSAGVSTTASARPSKPPPVQRPNSVSRSSQPPLPARPTQGHPLYHYVVEGPHCIALFDYVANQHDELSFKAGDVITLRNWMNLEWLSGTYLDNDGIFPASFVKVVEPPIGEPTLKAETPSTKKLESIAGPHAIARFDFVGDGCDDLSFSEGDVIQLAERMGTEWLKGSVEGKSGIFPASFVDIVQDLADETKSTFQNNTVTVLFDFKAQNDDELSIESGDRVTILHRSGFDWLYGETEDRKSGIFPSSFVDRIPDNLTEKPTFNAEALNEIKDKEADAAEKSDQSVKSNPDAAKVVALYDYAGSNDDDLSFKEGDVIVEVTEVDANWLRGKIGDKAGMFPRNFVSLDGAKITEMGKQSRKAIAVSTYVSETEGDLSFQEGDVIDVIKEVNSEWLIGKLAGKEGMFPANFVQAVD